MRWIVCAGFALSLAVVGTGQLVINEVAWGGTDASPYDEWIELYNPTDEPVDLTGIVEETLEPLAEQVLAEATQLWNGGAALDAILISGGGALLLGPYIRRHFRHARVVDDPVFANALGYWRFAQRLARS